MQNLAKEGRSIRDISDKFQIGRSTVHYHVRNYCQKMTTFDVTRLEEGEEGYVIGLFLGDGSFNRGNKDPRFFVRFALDAERDKDIAIKLAQIFGKVGKKINFIS